MKRSLLLMIFLITLSVLAAQCSGSSQNTHTDHEGGVHIMEPWARGGATTDGNGAIYFQVMNGGESDDVLVSVEGDIANTLEIHETTMNENDVMQMTPLTTLGIPANETVALEPGGKHIMLLGLTKDLTPGETIDLTLNFEKAGAMPITVEIREGSGGESHDHHNHNEEGHDNHTGEHSMDEMDQ
ncbi:MAG: copper chaperone PCu(A)C [Chloroflexota bacterium]